MMNTEILYDEIIRETSLSRDERLNAEYNKFMKPYFIDRNIVYPEPDYLLEIGGVPTMPKGNLVAVTAKWKNGKTFFCDILTAIFMGSDYFVNCRSLKERGRALFFDTEQCYTDTQRVQKTIDAMTPESRHEDYKVACLQAAPIDSEVGRTASPSRYDIICRCIAHEQPDLVIIDGIADLVYNYNDVIESQDIVSKLAAMANEYKCCIVVVMHQNKSLLDTNMKGHLGTLLYQKCSDVFTVEKHDNVFEVKHGPTRHRTCGDICFKLDADGIPLSAVADRQQQLEEKKQEDKAKLHAKLAKCFEGFTVPLRSTDVINLIQTKLGVGSTRAYQLLNKAKDEGILLTNDSKYYSLLEI
ncbi:MAG: AAA family ATPase [Muribaculaceae bacterium]|nr:AAA family ATPase [Muribaculaceae bacterium]